MCIRDRDERDGAMPRGAACGCPRLLTRARGTSVALRAAASGGTPATPGVPCPGAASPRLGVATGRAAPPGRRGLAPAPRRLPPAAPGVPLAASGAPSCLLLFLPLAAICLPRALPRLLPPGLLGRAAALLLG
eukprot:12792486-Alexandrium_andersonii.AAC.1